jgi:pimeloyl-ACP methyl ester carboxylesterase
LKQALSGAKPQSLLLLHGAGSGPWVFDGWQAAFPDLVVSAIDLHGGLDVPKTSMSDFAAVVARHAQELPQAVVFCGWSMGGLVALQAAAQVQPHSVVLLEGSPPGETQGFDPAVQPADGLFDPEGVYGPFPPGIRSRPESARARAERKRGISVPSLPAPALVVVGSEFADERGRPLADLYGADLVELPELDHWELVRSPRTRQIVREWLERDSPAHG